MTATDELRRLLDERGVEHKDIKRHYKGDFKPDKLYTLWSIRDYAAGSYISAKLHEEYGDDRGDEQEHFYCFSMTAYNLTPAQAVEATLGSDLQAENAKLRELVRDMWCEGMCECGSLGKCATCMYEYPTRMRELGVDA